jgi:molecular chaperone DnaK
VHRPEAAADRLDEALLDRLLVRAGARPEQLHPRRRRALLLSVRQMRHQLGRGGGDGTLVFPLGGRLLAATLTGSDLQRLTAPLLEKVAAGVAEALETAEIGAGDVEQILLVGGFAEGYGVRSALETLFSRGKAKVVSDRPRDAVALGAALRAAELDRGGRRATLPPEYRGVTPAAIGVRVLEPVTGIPGVDVLVTKGMALPCSSRRMYYTSQEGQQRLVFELVGVDGKEVAKLGAITLDALAARRGHAVELSLEIGLDGVMRVETYDSDSGGEQSARFHGRRDVVDPATVLYLERVRMANIVSSAGVA